MNTDESPDFKLFIQNIKISAKLGRTELYELGRNRPYFRTIDFPVEIKDLTNPEDLDILMGKIKGLDGKEYSLKLTEAQIDDNNRSSGHLYARKLIQEHFPYDRLFEEITLPGSFGLSADFIIPLRRVIFEVHGVQHYEYSAFFHGTLGNFQKSKIRDENKVKWANLNNFYYVELDDRNRDDWSEKIKGFYNYGKSFSENPS